MIDELGRLLEKSAHGLFWILSKHFPGRTGKL
jgi:hypothetical protein